MPAVFEHHHTVRPEEIDQLGHANNVSYLRWMQAAALRHTAEQGWSVEDYQRLGAGWVVRTNHIDYFKSAIVNDQLVIRTWVSNMVRVTSQRRYEILRPADEARIATAYTDWVFVRYADGAPIRIPPEVANAFEIVTDGESK